MAERRRSRRRGRSSADDEGEEAGERCCSSGNEDEKGDEEERETAKRAKMSRTRTETISLDQRYFQEIEERSVDDITLQFFYTPHTISLLLVAVVLVIYLAFSCDDADSGQNVWNGLRALCAFFLVVSLLAFPNGPFTRPHPAVWRLVFGVSVLYLMSLQFVLFQSFRDVKAVMTWLDPSRLSHLTLDEKEYAVNCSNITLERFWSNMDVFALSHFLGWAAKALLFRHWVLLWYVSIGWEVTEMFFAHVLPNFEECWWDAFLLDVLICNGLGICLGMFICHMLEMSEFHWESIKNIKSTRGKLKRAVLQFTPASFSRFRWTDPRSSPMRFVAVYGIVMFWLITELNTFFLKHIFAVDTAHPVNVYRVLIIVLSAGPTLRQYYSYVTDPRIKRIGTQTWIYLAIVVSESIICVKFGQEVFSNVQWLILFLWMALLAVGSVLCLYLSILLARFRTNVTEEVDMNGEIYHRFVDSSVENIYELSKSQGELPKTPQKIRMKKQKSS